MLEIKGYLTNLGKYNEGELIGKWVAFPIDENELSETLEEIGINDEYEEYFFTDWDCNFVHNFGEYENIEYINEVAETLEDRDEDLFNAICEIWDFNTALDANEYDYNLYEDINEDYDLGYYWAEQSGCYDLTSLGTLANYIDYESFGRDIRFETDGGFSAYGWVEYVG